MKICPNCKKKNNDINNWCGFCGGSLHAVPSERATGRASRTYEGRFIFCPSCGGRLEQEGFGGGDVFGSGLSFCPHCNYDVMSAAFIEPGQNSAPRGRSKPASTPAPNPGGGYAPGYGGNGAPAWPDSGSYGFQPGFGSPSPVKKRKGGLKWLLGGAGLLLLAGIVCLALFLGGKPAPAPQQPAAVPQSSSPVTSVPPVQPPQPVSDSENDAVKQSLANWFTDTGLVQMEQFSTTWGIALFMDVTHDGIDELVVLTNSPDMGNFYNIHAYTVLDDNVETIYAFNVHENRPYSIVGFYAKPVSDGYDLVFVESINGDDRQSESITELVVTIPENPGWDNPRFSFITVDGCSVEGNPISDADMADFQAKKASILSGCIPISPEAVLSGSLDGLVYCLYLPGESSTSPASAPGSDQASASPTVESAPAYTGEAAPAPAVSPLPDGEHFVRIKSWDGHTVQAELLRVEGVHENGNIIFSSTDTTVTLDLSESVISLDPVFGGSVHSSVDEALNFYIEKWGCCTKDVCYTQMVTVSNGIVTAFEFIYQA